MPKTQASPPNSWVLLSLILTLSMIDMTSNYGPNTHFFSIRSLPSPQENALEHVPITCANDSNFYNKGLFYLSDRHTI